MTVVVKDLAAQVYEVSPKSFRLRRTIMDGRPHRESLIRMGHPSREISEGESCLGFFISAERGILCFRESLQHGRRVIADERSLPGTLEGFATNALIELGNIASRVEQSTRKQRQSVKS
jgi:hypothetical protein